MVKLDNFYAIYMINGQYRVRSSNTLFTVLTPASSNLSSLEIWQLDEKGFFKPEQVPGFVQYIHSKAFPTEQTLKGLQRVHEESKGNKEIGVQND